jgi:hypothetical protein
LTERRCRRALLIPAGDNIAQMLAARVTVAGHRLTVVRVVMGQGEGDDTSVLLAAAGGAAEQLVHSVAPAFGQRPIATPA